MISRCFYQAIYASLGTRLPIQRVGSGRVGCLNSVDWSKAQDYTGVDYWTGLLDWPGLHACMSTDCNGTCVKLETSIPTCSGNAAEDWFQGLSKG